jgi:type IV pilus biogenesis protein CpaD/CtpE
VNTSTLWMGRPAALVALLWLAGCASTPRADASFGDAVRAAVASQVANPEAVRNTSPVSGVDGRAARAAQERYEHSYKQPQQEMTAPSGMVNTK